MDISQALEIVSYKLGMKLGERALEDSFLRADAVEQALHDKAANTSKVIDLKQYMLATKLVKQARAQAYAAENAEFLRQNAEQPGIVTTTSGLQYKIIKPGNGESPTLDDIVTVHYEGSLIDGSIFDSSLERGTPASFKVSKVIDGWTEGLQLMQEGAEYFFYIPQELAYGERGASSDIPAFSTLIFKVSLLAISKK